jgi:hypothetical protein
MMMELGETHFREYLRISIRGVELVFKIPFMKLNGLYLRCFCLSFLRYDTKR